MRIKYKVLLTNPTKDLLVVTDELDTMGSFEVSRNTHGVIIKGSYFDDNVEVKAYNSSFLGETYNLTETDCLSLEQDPYVITDIVELFSVLNTQITDDAFIKVQKYFKLAMKKGDTFKIDRFVEKPSDVFLIKITKDGMVSKLEGFIAPFSNVVTLTGLIDATDIVGYFLVSKPLRLDTDDHMFISNLDLLKLPSGFCKLTNTVLSKQRSELLIKETHLEYTSDIKGKLKFSSYVMIDGVRSLQYTIQENEKIVIDVCEDTSPFSSTNMQNNITLIYQATPDQELIPYLAVVGKEIGLESTTTDEQYLQLLTAAPEFLKSFFIKEYAIRLETIQNEYSINQPDVLDTLMTTSVFEGKILKI